MVESPQSLLLFRTLIEWSAELRERAARKVQIIVL